MRSIRQYRPKQLVLSLDCLHLGHKAQYIMLRGRCCQHVCICSQVQAAEAHEQYETLYFPHSLDFRGRAYPLPPHLSHLGADVCRGLMRFADAKPLGDRGFRCASATCFCYALLFHALHR